MKRSIKQNLTALSFMLATSAVFATAGFAMDWQGREGSTNVIDCRGGLVCGSACDPYRTTWQGIQCFFGAL